MPNHVPASLSLRRKNPDHRAGRQLRHAGRCEPELKLGDCGVPAELRIVCVGAGVHVRSSRPAALDLEDAQAPAAAGAFVEPDHGHLPCGAVAAGEGAFPGPRQALQIPQHRHRLPGERYQMRLAHLHLFRRDVPGGAI